MPEELAEAYESLQRVEIRATVENMENMLESLYKIRRVYKKLKEDEAHGGGPEADPGGRDGH